MQYSSATEIRKHIVAYRRRHQNGTRPSDQQLSRSSRSPSLDGRPNHIKLTTITPRTWQVVVLACFGRRLDADAASLQILEPSCDSDPPTTPQRSLGEQARLHHARALLPCRRARFLICTSCGAAEKIKTRAAGQRCTASLRDESRVASLRASGSQFCSPGTAGGGGLELCATYTWLVSKAHRTGNLFCHRRSRKKSCYKSKLRLAPCVHRVPPMQLEPSPKSRTARTRPKEHGIPAWRGE